MLRVLHSWPVRYGTALLAVGIALLAKLLLDPLAQQSGTPFVLFFTAVIISTVFGGFGPGLLATFVASLASDYFFLSPGRLLVQDGEYNLRLGIFVLEGLAISSLSVVLTSARRRAKRARRALHESDKRFRATFDQAAVGMARVSISSRWLEVNSKLCEILGYTEEEMYQLGLQDIIHPDDLNADIEQFKRMLSEELETYSAEKRYIHKYGHGVWVNQTLSAVRERSGRLEYFVCIIEDITERKRAEEVLKEQQEFLQQIIHTDPSLIFVKDWDGTFTLVNKAVADIYGTTVEELTGKSDADFNSNQEEVEAFLRVDREVMETLQSRYVSEEPVTDLRTGEVHWFQTIKVPLVSSIDGSRQVLGVSTDITERRRAEERIKQNLDVTVALYEAGQILGATLEIEEVETRLLRIVQRATNLTTAVISMQDADGDLRILRSCGLQNLWPRARYAPEAEAARRMALEKGGPRLFRLQPPDLGSEDLVGLCLPIRAHSRTIGVLEVYGPESLAESEVVSIIASLATQAASALENARLYRQLVERERQLQDLVETLLAAQEKERRRVAYEVHDGLAQMVASAHQHLQAFAHYRTLQSAEEREELDQLLHLVRQTVGEARRIIANLRPTALDEFGLEAAIRLQVEEMRREGWQVDYAAHLGNERLPDSVETTLFRVAQEALSNVRKHAQVSEVRIELGRGERGVSLLVRDQGQGFRLAESSAGRAGPGERVGLSSMRERVALLNGNLEIQSQPRAGTAVFAEIPLTAWPNNWSEEQSDGEV
jgi:PAS domain S-box-containing protein